MSTYTKDLNDIYFLNDKNIVQGLHETSTNDVNPIPSLSLLQDSYKELSNYTNTLSISLSTTISSLVETLSGNTRKLELSVDGISARTNAICAELSNIIKTKTDKLELSVSGISTEVNKKFVVKSGDSIQYLSVQTYLTVDNDISAKANMSLSGNLAVGKNVKINNNHDVIALGTNVEANKDHSFTWNADTAEKYSPNDVNTFNINPTNGTKGVFIGKTSLSNIIKDDVDASKNDLTSQISTVSSYIVDKYALSADVPTKTSQIINDGDGRGAQFIISSDLSIAYGTEGDTGTIKKHYIYLLNSSDQKVISKFDADILIKDSIIEDAKVEKRDGKTLIVLKIKTTLGETKEILIDVSDLVDIYKASGDGITLDTATNTFSLDFNVVGKKADIATNAENINTISTHTIPELSGKLITSQTNISNIWDYVDQLSGTGKYRPGIIPTLSHDISVLGIQTKTAVNYAGHIKINKYHPDFEAEYGSHISSIFKYFNLAINDQLKNGNVYDVTFQLDARLSSNPVYMADQYYDTADGVRLSHKDFIIIHSDDSRTYVDLKDLNKDTVQVVQAVRNYEYYALSDTVNVLYPWINGNNRLTTVYDISVYNSSGTPVLCTLTGHAISGNNDIGGNNDFRDGDNRFYGRNYFIESQTDFNSISCRGAISADGIISTATQLIVANGNVSADSNGISTLNNISAGVKINVADNMIVDANRLAVNNISVADYLSVGNMLSVAKKVDLLTSNIVIDEKGISSKYDISVDADVYISSDLYVAQNLTVTRISAELSKPTLFDETVRISGNLSVDDVLTATHADKKLTVNNLKVNNNATICALTAETLSAGTLSVDWSKAVNPSNGYSLLNLSVDLSNKIWIKDIAATDAFKDGTTSDLSIIKIAKDDYDKMVGRGDEPLCSNVLYVVSADYMDAYGQVLCNLVMTNDDIPSDATNKHYVDTICTDLSIEIEKLSTALSNDIDKLSSDLSSEIEKLSTALSNEIIDLSTDLSTAISAKIWIKDIAATDAFKDGTTSDLSIVKIAKDDYDMMVGFGDEPLCSNVLYVVSADYMDAYEQVLSNLVMTNDNTPTEATNKHYVDTLSTNLSNEISKVRTVFKNLYTKINTINNTSSISTIIDAVVEIKNAISNLTAY